MGKSGNPNIAEAGKKTRFKKGEPVPKGGRPKGSISLTDAIRRASERDYESKDPITGEYETKQVRDWVGIALAGKAMRGDVAAIKEMLDRLDGKVVDKTEITGKDGQPLSIEHSVGLSTIRDRLSCVRQSVTPRDNKGPAKT